MIAMTDIAPNATHIVRITCNCETCKVNAARVGATFPLAAWITPGTAAMLKITDRTATRASKTHGSVVLAHDPKVSPHQRLAIPA